MNASAVEIGRIDIEVRRAADTVTQRGKNRRRRIAGPVSVPDVINMGARSDNRAAMVRDPIGIRLASANLCSPLWRMFPRTDWL